MQRGMNDNLEPDRNDKSPDSDEHIDDQRDRSIENEDEQDSLRVNRRDDSGLTGKDAPDGLTDTDDVVDDDDDELDDSDIIEPIESGEAG